MTKHTIFQLIRLGQDNPEFTFEDFTLARKVLRLAKKHHYLAECSCNGEGWVKGQRYYNGTIDDYAKRTYGYNVRSAYINEDEDIFDFESDKIQDKIKALIGKKALWKVEFQGDSRGLTVKLYYNNTLLNEVI